MEGLKRLLINIIEIILFTLIFMLFLSDLWIENKHIGVMEVKSIAFVCGLFASIIRSVYSEIIKRCEKILQKQDEILKKLNK